MVLAPAGPGDPVTAAVRVGRQPGFLDAIAFLGMLVFGIVMALLGAVMPVISGRLGIGLGDVGNLFLAMNAAMLLASLVIGPATDRFGMKSPIVLGSIMVAAALLGITRASGIGALLPSVAILGAGGGVLNATTNTLVADLHDDTAAKQSALNLLGVFFGFGALILPFSIGALLSSVGIDGLLLAGAVLCVVTALAAAMLHFPAPKQAHGFPLADMRRLATLPLVLALAFLLFFESGNEFLLGGYFSTLLVRELGVEVTRASYLLSAYWAAIMFGRLAMSRVSLSSDGYRVVAGAAMLAGVGALVVMRSQSVPFMVAGCVLTGLALAGIFPTVLGIAASAFRERSGTVFGILFTVALTGGMTIPWLAGHVAERMGLRTVFLMAALGFAMVAALSATARGLGRQATLRV